MASLTVCVVAADQKIWSGEAKQVSAKTTEGEIGILAGHEPLLALLAEGEVRVTTVDDQKIVVNAEGGFFSVDNDEVQVVAGRAQLVS